MFEFFYWSNLVESVNRLPKEIVAGVVAAYVILEVHKRNSEVKIAVAEAETRKAEVELEALKLQQKPS